MNRRDALRSLLAAPAVASVQVARMQPQDVVVFRAKGRLSQDAVARIGRDMAVAFPGQKCVVLDEDASLEIVRPEA